MWQETRQIRQRFISVHSIVLLLTVFLLPVIARGEEQAPALSAELRQLIHKVKQNEALYQSLKLKMKMTENDHAELIQYDGPKPIERDSTISLIRQGEKFRQQIQTKGRYVMTFSLGLYWLQDGYRATDPAETHENETWIQVESGTKENLTLFDGTTFRSFWEESMTAEGKEEPSRRSKRGLISNSPSGTLNQISPHRFLLEPEQLPAPLSSYLTGKKAVQAHTDQFVANTRITETGKATVQGLNCITLRIETLDSSGKPRSRTDLWLAQDRNLIPLRREYFIYHVSKELPVSESVVDRWQEIQPGIWFPSQVHTNQYYARMGKRVPSQKPSMHKEYTLESIELNPQLPSDVFTKLDFAPGTPVTVVSDRRLVKRYRQGEEK